MATMKTLNGYGFNATELNGKAPEYYIQPRNLLDNSDFTNLVNQRGITSETSVSAYSYFIDRWVNQTSEARSFTLSTSGIGLPLATTLLQKIEKIEAGKIVTFAIKLSDGTIATLTGTVQHTSDGSWMRFASITHSFGDMYMETMNGVVNVVVYNTKAIAIEWAALYEGTYTADTLPKYVPKGYGAELAECQRYYYTIKSDGSSYAAYATGVMNDTSSAYFPIVMPIPMRIPPTLSYSGNFRVYVNGAGRSITNMENDQQSRYSSRILINNISSGVSGQACELQSSNDGTAFIAFSADL